MAIFGKLTYNNINLIFDLNNNSKASNNDFYFRTKRH